MINQSPSPATNNNITPNSNQFWLECEITKNGYEKISFKLGEKHYIGFLNEKERKDKEGKVLSYYKLAKMRECNWEGCQICHSSVFFV